MPSSWSSSLRFELQFPGENINLWGDKLNSVVQRVDSAVAGWITKALTGNYTLTTANGSADEARSAMLKFTGTGPYTVTIPSVSKRYDVWNAMSGALTITTGAGATAVLQAGEKCSVMCDSAGVYRIQPTDFGGAKITSVGTPTANTDAATKAYVDGVAWSYNAGNLPGQAGNAGALLTTDGVTASWMQVTVSDIPGAAPLSAPAFTGGVSVSGSTKSNAQAVSALAIDLSAADFFTKSISTNSTFTFTNATASKAQAFVIELTISGSAVPSWPASVRWSGGINPSSGLGNGVHILGFVTFDGGVTWTGAVGPINVSA